jgi:peptidoglycan hydrolase-like protein with peptidoglycan-binding domain
MSGRRTAGLIGLLVVTLAIGGGVGWAVAKVFGSPEPAVTEAEHTFVEVGPGEVSATVNLGANAQWQVESVGANRGSGTVTAVGVEPGQQVESGDILYRVDERPVTIAEGEIPAFRVMSRGINGVDVAQLQQLLIDLELYGGPVDGVFGIQVRDSVRAWQRELGITVDGVVALGDIVFVPSLPISVVLNEEIIAVGRLLSGGEPAIGALPDSPTFSVSVSSSSQIALIPEGTPLTLTGVVSGETVEWEGVAGVPGFSPTSQVVFLNSPGAGRICGNQCDLVPLGFGAALQATVVTVPLTTGMVVPVGALVTTASGQTGIIDDSGNTVPVTVIASARGMVVVEGVAAGTRVRVPGRS